MAISNVPCRRRAHPWASATLGAACLAACAEHAQLPFNAGVGPQPQLPLPSHRLIPTVNVAEAEGWDAGAAPQPAAGAVVTAFAQGLSHPRWLLVLPNGDVLVAQSDAPPKPAEHGIKAWFMQHYMKRAGAGVPSPDRIVLLRDRDGDGRAETRSVLLRDLHSPFGMALVGSDLYVADTDALLRFAYTPGALQITTPATKVLDLPAGPINHHWTKNVLASPDGSKLYVTIGSNSNVGENGLAQEAGRACIWEVDPQTGAHRLFAWGLRNPNGLAWEPSTGGLWVVVNERDELGSDLVPDYLTAVRDGGFYGWPFSYYGPHIDTRVSPPQPDLVRRAIVPDYALGTHVAALGLAMGTAAALPGAFAHEGAFIGEHGSWNRDPRAGYDVVYVPFDGGRPAGPPVEVLGGFLDAQGKAHGRPVGVAIDRRGGLLVADDVGNTVWRVSRG